MHVPKSLDMSLPVTDAAEQYIIPSERLSTAMAEQRSKPRFLTIIDGRIFLFPGNEPDRGSDRRYLSTTVSVPQRNLASGRRVLPITIASKTYNAVPDTGSVDNVISEKFARSLGAVFTARETSEKYHNACGEAFDARWTTSLPCAFAGESESKRTCQFSVVTGLAVPLVMGSKFLEITETLTKFTSRLVRVANKTLARWRLLHLQLPRRQLKCTMNGRKVFANADTGSNVDLVSLAYARRRKWKIENIPNNIRTVELADGSLRQLAGKVRFQLSAGDTGSKKVPMRTFYVLPGLTSDVLLGDDTLEKIDAFETHMDDFMDVEVDFNSVDLIYWAGNEGWPSMETLLQEGQSNATGGGTNVVNDPVFKKASISRLFRRKRRIWKAREIIGHEPPYERYMERVANWHERQKDEFDKKMEKLAGPAKSQAEQEEQDRCQKYEELRGRVQALHEQRKAASQA